MSPMELDVTKIWSSLSTSCSETCSLGDAKILPSCRGIVTYELWVMIAVRARAIRGVSPRAPIRRRIVLGGHPQAPGRGAPLHPLWCEDKGKHWGTPPNPRQGDPCTPFS